MKKKLTGTWKKYRIVAGPNEWQQVCNRLNPGKTGRSCEGPDFSWLSSKVEPEPGVGNTRNYTLEMSCQA
jgi:hypothetical protein